MKFKCLGCGHVFESGEERRWREVHGEELVGCPVCGCGFREATPCRVCFGAFLEDELCDGVCEECLEERDGKA